MILTAHQPVYLPWIGLFHKISLANTFVIFDTVQYLPKEWMNRNKIKIKNNFTYLSVPILDKGYLEKKIFEIEINNNSNWRKKHFKSIYLNYKKSKYFKNYISFFEETYSKNWKYLSDLNNHMLKFYLKELNIDVKILKASDLKIVGKKSDLVLDMCKKLKIQFEFEGQKKFTKKKLYSLIQEQLN